MSIDLELFCSAGSVPAWAVSSPAPGVTSSNSQSTLLGKSDVHWLIPMVRVPLFCSFGWGCFDSCSLSTSNCKGCVGLFRDCGFFKDLAAVVLKVAVIFKSREEEMCSVCVCGNISSEGQSLWECPLPWDAHQCVHLGRFLT